MDTTKRANVIWSMFLLMLVSFAWVKPAHAEALPHYFPEGLVTTTKPLDQWALILEAIKASSLCQMPPPGAAWVINSRAIKETHEIYGKKVNFHFNFWTRENSPPEKVGKIYYTDYCGRKEITEEQFATVREKFLAYYTGGVDGAYEKQKNIASLAIKALALSQKKSEAEIREQLAKVVPELAHLSPPVTFREFLRIPEEPFSKSDFVQTEAHIVHGHYWGMVIIDTELVYLTPQGQMIDHVIGKPTVAVHELTHGNQKLQSLLDDLEHEYLASIPMLLIPEDKFFFMFHGYVGDMREIAEVLFGFNFKQARKEIFVHPIDGMNVRINEQKLNQYAGELDTIKAALLRHYLEVALPELYAHRLYWASLCNKLGDDYCWARILAMKDFDPTGLGGHSKAMEWVLTRESEIKEMSDRAFEASGTVPVEVNMSGRRSSRDLSSLRRLMTLTGMNEEQLRSLAKKHDLDIKKLSQVSEEEALDMILDILRAEREAQFPLTKEDVK